MRQKREQAESDHHEMCRDLSTYEYNFSQLQYGELDGQGSSKLGDRLNRMHNLVLNAREKLRMALKFDDVGQGYFSETVSEQELPSPPG